MKLASLSVPYPPTTGNHMHGSRRGVGKFLKAPVLVYYKEVFYAVHQARQSNQACPFIISKPSCLILNVYPPDNRKRDIDNMLKPLKDALKKASLITDDSLFKQIAVTMHPCDGKPRVEIEVYEPIESLTNITKKPSP